MKNSEHNKVIQSLLKSIRLALVLSMLLWQNELIFVYIDGYVVSGGRRQGNFTSKQTQTDANILFHSGVFIFQTMLKHEKWCKKE